MPHIWKDTELELRHNKAFTHDGISYPRQWLTRSTPEQREAIGLIWVDDDRPRVNETYYEVRGQRGDWTTTPKDLDGLKKNAVDSCKKTAGNKLSGSDWMVVRATEGGTEVPEDWAAYRAEVREYSNSYEVAIDEATFESIQNMADEWPESPSEKVQREADEAAMVAAEAEGGPN